VTQFEKMHRKHHTKI